MKIQISAILVGCVSVMAAGSASAVIVDLTVQGASGSIGDCLFQQINSEPVGTGYFDPFLRIQAIGVERGVNSDGPYTMDEEAGIWTHSIVVSTFKHVDNGGVESIRFLLDINENTVQPLLGLDMFRVYVANAGTYNTLAQLDANGVLIYNMDAIEDSAVHLDYGLNAGSDWGDMLAYLPAALFRGHESQYLYLFCQFGGEGAPWNSDDGFEEWVDIDGIAPSSAPEDGIANARDAVRVIPSPSMGKVLIAYGHPTAVVIEVFNAAGALVRRLSEGPRVVGQYAVEWDARDDRGNTLPSGVYLARIVTGKGMRTGRIIISR